MFGDIQKCIAGDHKAAVQSRAWNSMSFFQSMFQGARRSKLETQAKSGYVEAVAKEDLLRHMLIRPMHGSKILSAWGDNRAVVCCQN